MNCKQFVSRLLLIRNYSQYSKDFVEPIYRFRDQEEAVRTGINKQLKHVRIKAAKDAESPSQFHDIVKEKFVNYIMLGGCKDAARKQLDAALERVKRIQIERYHKAVTDEERAQIILDPLQVMKKAISNCRPLLKVRAIRRGGSTYQVPVPINDIESSFRAMRWMVLSSRDKEGTTKFFEKLAQEIVDASECRGRVYKQKVDLHKLCEANRAYAHYRWL